MAPAADFCERVLRTFWRHSPVNASFLGIHDYDHRLASYDSDALAERRSDFRRHLREIEALRASGESLSGDERLDLALLEGELKTALRTEEELRIPFRNPGAYLEDATYGVYLLMMREFAPAEERARSAVSRLEAVPRLLGRDRPMARRSHPRTSSPKRSIPIVIGPTRRGGSWVGGRSAAARGV